MLSKDEMDEIKDWERKIPQLSQIECARLWRFSSSGHPLFDERYGLFDNFKKHFDSVGGMTPKISKLIGW